MRYLAALLLVAATAADAAAQSSTRGAVSVAGDVVLLDTRGASTASIAVSGTWTGTINFEVSVGSGNPVTVDCATPAAPGSAVNSTTSSGVWVCPVAGMSSIQARLSGSPTGSAIVDILAAPAAGQTVAAAGGGGSFDGVLVDAAGGDPVTDTSNDAIRVNVVAGAGSGGTAVADDADFVDGTTSGTPIGGVAESASPTTVTEGDFGWAAITLNRALKTSLYNASGTAAFGTAGTAAAPVLTVQGITSMTPVVVSATNLDVQIGGSDTLTVASHNVTNAGTFAVQAAQSGTWNVGGSAGAATAFLPVRLSDGSNFLSIAGDLAEDGAHVDGESGPLVLSRRIDTAASSAGASGDRATFNTDALGRLWTRPGQPCADHARIQSAAISTSSSGNVEVVALNGSDLIYVCGYSLIAGAATAVQFIYGTGTACATGETDITGAWSLAANGGITQANAGVPQFAAIPAGNALCIENSGANAVQGHVTYVRTAAP